MRLDALRPWFHRLDRWEKAAGVVWAGALLAVCVRLALSARYLGVYPIFAAAGRAWPAGQGLYRLVDHLDYYRYSPLVAVMLVPFSLLPDWLGGIVWRLVNAGVYLAALAWWSRAVLPRLLSRSQHALLLLLVAPLSIGNLHTGQCNTLVLGLLLAATAAVAGGRWSLASACVAVACLFKVYPLAVLLLLAAVYPRQFAARAFAALAVGCAVPFLLQSPAYVAAQYVAWWHHLLAYDRRILSTEFWYRDLRLLCQVCGVPLSDRAYVAVQLLTGAGIALVCLAARRAGWTQRGLLTLLLALGCCWMTLFGSATESATYVLLAPALAWAVLEAWLADRPRWVLAALFSSYGLFVACQMASWFPVARQVHSLGLQPLAALLLFGVLLLDARLPAVRRKIEPTPAAV